MADDFDPYYTWLSIRPDQQPPDHYRLVGVQQFEDNADVIANAMDQRMQFLRNMQVGKRSALSQKLLNEISAAGGCLLDPKRKEAYDKELRAKAPKAKALSLPQAAAIPAPARPIPAPIPAAAKPAPSRSSAPLPVASPLPVITQEAQFLNKSTPLPASRGTSRMVPLFVAAVGVLAFIIAIVIAARQMFSGGEAEIAAIPPAVKTTVPATKTPTTAPPKPGPEELTPLSENKTEKAPKPPKTIPEKTPETRPETVPPTVTKVGETSPKPSSAQAWWQDPQLLDRLVALHIDQNARAEFLATNGRTSMEKPATIEFWLRLHLDANKLSQIAGTRLGNQESGFVPKGWALLGRIVPQNGQQRTVLVFEQWKTNAEYLQNSVALKNPEEWHHVALVFNPDKEGRFFLDGRPLFAISKDEKYASSGRNFMLGGEMQPAGAAFQADFCGLRVSEGARYTEVFSPPPPVEFKQDDATFALLDSQMECPGGGGLRSPVEVATKRISLKTGAEVSRRPTVETVVTTEPSGNSEPFNPNERPPPTTSAPRKKSPIPTGDALAKAKEQVNAIFENDIKAAKLPKAKQELAQKIFNLAKETSELPSRFALLEDARKLAVEAKDASLASSILESLAADFEIDLLAQRVKLLDSLAAEGLSMPQRSDLLSQACELGYALIDEGRYDAVPSLVTVARSLTAKSITPEAKAESKEFFEFAAQRQKRIDTLKRAEQTLATSPDDPAANLILGLHHCFSRRDFKQGLPHLVKGSDAKLAAAAKMRQQNVAKGVQSTPEEADAWYDAIANVPAEYKGDVQRQALEGYTFLASSGTGLDKVKAEKRRDELSALAAATPERKGATKKPRMNDLPETSPGMIGRVLIDGKDAGYLLTHQPPGEMDFGRLQDILTQTKAKGGRIVLVGVVSSPNPFGLRVFHMGRDGGPAQLVSVNGKQMSAAGGTFGRTDSREIQLPAGDHLVQWLCDFDGSNTPRLDFYIDTGGSSRQVRPYYTRAQNYEARKIPTKSEMSLSN